MSEKFEPKIPQTPKKEFEEIQRTLDEREKRRNEMSVTPSARNRAARWRSNSRLLYRQEELKGQAEVEATELNKKYDELINVAMKALSDLREFEINELGIKPENAISGDLDEHRSDESDQKG